MKRKPLISILAFAAVLAALAFIFKPMLQGKVPVPLDALAGTYYPWLDFDWGYPAGVPVKNIAVTDVFSQLYPWRKLAMESWRQGQVPLWNPQMFSGAPLLGNWQSAPFYPLNVLMLIFGDLWGWSFMVLVQPLLAISFTYLYLRSLKLKTHAAVAGGFIFAFAGFMTTYLEYNTTGQILIWLPLLLYLTEKYFAGKKLIFLSGISLAIFMVAVAGFFQPALYVYVTFAAYFLLKTLGQKQGRPMALLSLSFFVILGLALAAVQLLPTLETLQLSIRNQDANIFEYQFGLLPLGNLLTLFAPDFFGNPVTFNFWGFMQYQETAGYFGITALVLIASGLVSKKQTFVRNFFTVVFFASLILAFRNPLSQLIYTLKVPFISTGYASRWLMLTGFSAGILAALGLDSDNRRAWIKFGLVVAVAAAMLTIYVYGYRYLLTHPFDNFDPQADKILTNIYVSWRNTLYSLAVAGLFALMAIIFNRWRYLPLLLLAIVVLDLTRFTYKFTPFAPTNMARTDLPVANFLGDNLGHYRFEAESGPIFPASTWSYFGFMSPSGYDPLVSKHYSSWYRVYNSSASEATPSAAKLTEGKFTRYLVRSEYNTPLMDLAGVKYLAMLRRDQDGIIYRPGENFYYAFDPDNFKRVFESGTVVVFENPRVLPRVSLWDEVVVEPNYPEALARLHGGFDFQRQVILSASPTASLKRTQGDSAEIVDYQANAVLINTKTASPTVLMLTDTYFPGWEARVDDQPTAILVADGIYRAIELPQGQHRVEFVYRPQAFTQGSKISLLALIVLGLVTLKNLRLSKNIFRF